MLKCEVYRIPLPRGQMPWTHSARATSYPFSPLWSLARMWLRQFPDPRVRYCFRMASCRRYGRRGANCVKLFLAARLLGSVPDGRARAQHTSLTYRGRPVHGCSLGDQFINHKPEIDVDRPRSLADFRQPPVAETSLGLYFPALSAWSFVHFGALWEKFKDKYPKPEYRPPIQMPTQPQQVLMQVLADFGKFPIRTCFVDNSSTQLVQVQSDCFFHNWRKTAETPQYQHYENIRPTFVQDWETFCKFLEENSFQRPQISRCEMTYFNHLVRGEDWQSISELPSMFPAWQVSGTSEPLSKVEMVNLSVWYEHSGGKVQVSLSPGIRQTDGKEVIQLTVTATATPAGSTDEELFNCLDTCHETAVVSFLKLTSEPLQKKWGRIR